MKGVGLGAILSLSVQGESCSVSPGGACVRLVGSEVCNAAINPVSKS